MAAAKKPSLNFADMMKQFRHHAELMRAGGANNVLVDFGGVVFHAIYDEGTNGHHVGSTIGSEEDEDDDGMGFH